MSDHNNEQLTSSGSTLGGTETAKTVHETPDNADQPRCPLVRILALLAAIEPQNFTLRTWDESVCTCLDCRRSFSGDESVSRRLNTEDAGSGARYVLTKIDACLQYYFTKAVVSADDSDILDF
jgi:hypothetical protein